jgi:type VI protein secretion system component VasK
MEGPFLNYFALGLLFFVVIVLVYGIIAIHDIPARIAHTRHHPHEDAIHAAGWISLFMLHVLWPFLWIWAMMYRPDRGWGFAHKPGEPTSPKEAVAELEELRHRLAEVEARLEKRKAHFGEGEPGSGSPGPMILPVEKENVPAAGTAPAASRGAQR